MVANVLAVFEDAAPFAAELHFRTTAPPPNRQRRKASIRHGSALSQKQTVLGGRLASKAAVEAPSLAFRPRWTSSVGTVLFDLEIAVSAPSNVNTPVPTDLTEIVMSRVAPAMPFSQRSALAARAAAATQAVGPPTPETVAMPLSIVLLSMENVNGAFLILALERSRRSNPALLFWQRILNAAVSLSSFVPMWSTCCAG